MLGWSRPSGQRSEDGRPCAKAYSIACNARPKPN
jgi:hypothetical protein